MDCGRKSTLTCSPARPIRRWRWPRRRRRDVRNRPSPALRSVGDGANACRWRRVRAIDIDGAAAFRWAGLPHDGQAARRAGRQASVPRCHRTLIFQAIIAFLGHPGCPVGCGCLVRAGTEGCENQPNHRPLGPVGGVMRVWRRAGPKSFSLFFTEKMLDLPIERT